MMSDDKPALPKKTAALPERPRSDNAAIDAFVRQARTLARPGQSEGGRLILALDATMSRQPTWDLACTLQGEMFDAVGEAGRLSVQLVYFRGFGECRASRFVADTEALKRLMAGIACQGGHTQIGKVFAHALAEHGRAKVNALVFIGDAMEESIDALAEKAGQLGLHGVPIFLFQEGRAPAVEAAYKEFARLSKGAWFRFDRSAAAALAKLLSAVAVFAAGGLPALAARGRPEDLLMIRHLKGGAG